MESVMYLLYIASRVICSKQNTRLPGKGRLHNAGLEFGQFEGKASWS